VPRLTRCTALRTMPLMTCFWQFLLHIKSTSQLYRKICKGWRNCTGKVMHANANKVHRGGAEVQLHPMSTSAINEGFWWASRSDRFIPGKTIQWVGAWLGLTTYQVVLEHGKIDCPCRDSNIRSSSPQHSHYTNLDTPHCLQHSSCCSWQSSEHTDTLCV
jgi:hypothetical protein